MSAPVELASGEVIVAQEVMVVVRVEDSPCLSLIARREQPDPRQWFDGDR
jgi:hypothetical protein